MFFDFIIEELDSTLKLSVGEKLDIIQKKIEKVRNNKYWVGVLELSRIFLLLNIYLYVYTKGNYSYEIYFKFEVDKQNEEFKLLYINSNYRKSYSHVRPESCPPIKFKNFHK